MTDEIVTKVLTNMGIHPEEFQAVMQEFTALEAQVEALDLENGTKRPDGFSLGRIYERMGMLVVSMCRADIEPTRALTLIQTLSEDQDEIAAAAAMAQVQQSDDLTGPMMLFTTPGEG